MKLMTKPVSDLNPSDLERHPVWEYSNADELWSDETVVKPVKLLPVDTLQGRVVGTLLRLANGGDAWGLLGNIDTASARMTRHFLTVSVFNDGRWFAMARYHDVDYRERGPAALSAFLGLRVGDVFPIQYDVRQHVEGNSAALAGDILAEPSETLTRAELITMSVTGD